MWRSLKAGSVNAAVVAASLAITYLVSQFIFYHLDDRSADPCDDRWPEAP